MIDISNRPDLPDKVGAKEKVPQELPYNGRGPVQLSEIWL